MPNHANGRHGRGWRAAGPRNTGAAWRGIMAGSGVEKYDAGGDGGRGAAQELPMCTSPPFVGDRLPRSAVTDKSSEPAKERRLRRTSRESALQPTGACVELEKEDVRLDGSSREDAE